MDRANHSKSRVSQYLFVGIGLTLLYIAFRGNEWKGSGSLHSAMEVFATLLALIVGVLSLKKYYDSRESKYLVIGAGFLGTSVLDGYHALVTSSAINVYLPSSWDSLIGWSWIASRLFLGVLLFFSYIVYRREQNLGVAGRIFPKVLYLFIGLMTAISFVFFVIVPLPRAYYPEYIFHRPEEFLPAFFFFLALVGYLKKGEWKFDSFEHWLVLSLVINVVSQVVFMSFSGAVFDFEFDVAHSLKKVSYICVLIGLVLILKRSLNEEPKEFVVDENLRLSAFGAKLSILVTSLIIFSMFIVSIVFFQDKVEAQRVQENELLQKDLKIISKLFKDDVERLKDEVVLLKNMPPVSGIVRALNNNGFDEQGNSTIAQWKGRLKNIFKQYSLSRQSVESVAYWRVDREAEILVEVSEGKSAFRPFGHLDVKAFKTEMDVKVAYFDIIDEVVHSVVAVPVFDGKELFGIVALESKKNDIFDDIRNHLPKHQKLYIFDNDQKLVVAGANKHNEKLNSLTSRIQKKYLENKNPVDSVSYLSPAKSKAFSASKLELGRDYSYNFLLFTNYELIHRSTQGSISKVLLTGGIVLVFSLVILWFIAYTLTSPLMYMSETVKAYAETGQLLDLPDKSTDEIGILARAFKDSVDQVNRTIQDLETQTYALNEHSLISMTDTLGKIIYANDKFCDVSQYSLDELLGKDHRVLNSGTHSTAFMKTLWETIKGGGVWQGELCNKAKDGSLYWVD
ncbi:MAG: PAS domain-containing protein, partial [Lentisphaeraceae bacterium]|nr:PAS domain-containing protein [Lentisphaeraceae bacterium]